MVVKKMLSKTLFGLIIALLAIGAAYSQLDKPTNDSIRCARRPALSPDGSKFAFVYKGDIWVVPSSGGRAFRLTDNVEQDTEPIFSPDGNWIAFTSYRNGNADIFVMPSTGGNPRQITFSGENETAADWSPDGKSILFIGSRDRPDVGFFITDIKTLKYRKIADDFYKVTCPSFSPDGKKLVISRKGRTWQRPRANGSAIGQVVVIDLATSKRQQLSKDERQHLWPKFLPDNKTVICMATGELTPSTRKLGEKPTKFVDNPLRTPNLWAFDLEGNSRQLTHFVGDSVRWPSVARNTGDIAFEYFDSIYLLKKGSKEPVKVTIYAPGDDKENTFRREVVKNGASDAQVSPDGKTIVFSSKSELWSIPVEKSKKRNADEATRLTNNPGYDGDFCWSKDSQKVFFVSDREGPLSLFELDMQTLAIKRMFKKEGDIFSPQVTPDGKRIAFFVTDEGLYTIPVEGGDAVKAVDRPEIGIKAEDKFAFSISPDSQWVAFTTLGEFGAIDVWIASLQDGKPFNITKYNNVHLQPVWSPDGKYLYFVGDHGGWGVFLIPLKREEATVEDIELKLDMPKDNAPVKVEIDFTDIELRVRRLTSQSSDNSLTVGADGTLYFISDGNTWSTSFDGKDTKRLTKDGDVTSLHVMPDGKKLILTKNGAIQTLSLDKNSLEQIAFAGNWQYDTLQVRMATLNQLWRGYNRSFYDENFQGRDWNAILKKYVDLLPWMVTRVEFGELLFSMLAELDASHAEAGAGGGEPTPPSTATLGFYFDYNYDGPGLRILEVPDGSPGSYEKTKLTPGEFVLEVNGHPVQTDENLFLMLNNYSGKDLELLVNSKPVKEGARKVTYKDPGGWGPVPYQNNMKRARKLVDERSGGRIAYLHIPSMGEDGLILFEREFYERVVGKDAAIIDVRFNGGGYVADTIVSYLAIKPYGYSTARHSKPIQTPVRSWAKPMAVVIAEPVFSDAELFTYLMKQTGLATIVGMPTSGSVIWTTGFPLLEGSGAGARLPIAGSYRLDGTTIENDGEKPDIYVDVTYEDWKAGRDPQLEAAVDVLMKKLQK